MWNPLFGGMDAISSTYTPKLSPGVQTNEHEKRESLGNARVTRLFSATVELFG
jgi:hypothetical protein